jgi:NAD-dependent histone deacetylase SIR2
MTLFVPLDADTPLPPTPAFLNEVADPAAEFRKVVKAVLKAKRIAFVCGKLLSAPMCD